MAIEIERKFLIESNEWKNHVKTGRVIIQGYFAQNKDCTVRIRRNIGAKSFITIKSKTKGMSRNEFEYDIPDDDADFMLNNFCQTFVHKVRYKTKYRGLIWEIDKFVKNNAGLVLAEVEMSSESQNVEIPSWVGREVTMKNKYSNASLARTPYSSWKGKLKK